MERVLVTLHDSLEALRVKLKISRRVLIGMAKNIYPYICLFWSRFVAAPDKLGSDLQFGF